MSESNLKNNNLFSAVNLVEDLDNKAAETISGGYEVFTIRNRTSNSDITYYVDGTISRTLAPGEDTEWTAYSGGIIEFDQDNRSDVYASKTYDLANGGIYEFQDNGTTPGNPYDIDLYSV